VYFWRFERVVCRKMDGEEENATRVWTITLIQLVAIRERDVVDGMGPRGVAYRSHDGRLPVKLLRVSDITI
jgi:hypothetical protein